MGQGALGSHPQNVKGGLARGPGFSVGRGIPGQNQPGLLRPEVCLVVGRTQPLTPRPSLPCRRCVTHGIRLPPVGITHHGKLTPGNHGPVTCAGRCEWDGAIYLLLLSPHCPLENLSFVCIIIFFLFATQKK